MAKTRSPSYPAIGLREAVAKAKLIYDADYQNRVPKEVIAGHLGYKSLSGASLPIIAALSQYGLLEGRGNETRVSDIGLQLIHGEVGTGERMRAAREAALGPDLFAELYTRWQGKVSDSTLRSYLLTKKFIPTAADTAVRSFRETLELLNEEENAYRDRNPEAAFQADFDQVLGDSMDFPTPQRAPAAPQKAGPAQLPTGTRKEIIALEEGDVVITFPDELSAESFEDLKSYFDLFIRKMQRRTNKSDA